MKAQTTRIILAGLLALASAGEGVARPEAVGRELRLLGSRAAHKSGWTALRRFAQSSKDSGQRGWAYFALGYREFAAGEYQPAFDDLRRALGERWPLTDYAEYYAALSAQNLQRTEEAAKFLEGFAERHPESTLRLRAAEFVARANFLVSRPERAVEALLGESRARQDPALALLLAEAYRKASKPVEAARAYQDVYYAFPTSPESRSAGEAIGALRADLGEKLPDAPEEIKTARAEGLFKSGRYEEALEDYDVLLAARPAGPLSGRWKVGRARCLLRLQRLADAVLALELNFTTDPDVDADRLATLVEAHLALEDLAAVTWALDQLGELYPRAPAYASALAAVGRRFRRQADWKSAARYFQPLAEGFPQDDLGREAHWGLAWAYYLDRQETEARRAFAQHVERYPTSPRVSAAIYWLGRLAESRGSRVEARAYYRFLRRRFVHSYYSLRATERLKGLAEAPAAARTKQTPPPTPADDVIARVPKPDPPPVAPCVAPGSSAPSRAFQTLQALKLDDLAQQYLESVVSDRPAAPELLYALSKLKVAQGDPTGALFDGRRAVPNFVEYDFSALPEDLWNVLFPRAYWTLVRRQARAQGLDPHLVLAVIRQESAFNPRATSPANARGLMQVLPRTASPSPRRRRSVALRLYDPSYNVRLGTRHLRGLVRAYDGNLERALAAYNAGKSRVNRWLEQPSWPEADEFLESIPLRETRYYVEAVLRDAAIYRGLINRKVKSRNCG